MFLCSSFIVHAECTNEEREKLLEQANNIVVNFEADLNANKFNFYLYNLTSDLYVIINNEIDEKTVYGNNVSGVYTFSTDDIDNQRTYSIKIYANTNNCSGKFLTSKLVKKGIINKFAKEEVCNGIEEYYYCNSVLDTPITISDEMVYKNIENYKNQSNVNLNNKKSNNIMFLIKKYWYFLVIILAIICVIFFIKLINKKKSKLM